MKIINLLEDREIFNPKISFSPKNISDTKYERSYSRYRDKDFNWHRLERKNNEPVYLDKSNKLQILGTGKGGSAIQHKDNIGEITKISKPTNNLNHDAYYTYIKTIVKNNLMQKNPYYPRIYNFKIIKGKYDQKFSYRIKIEKLYPVDKLNEQEIQGLIERIIPEDKIQEMIKKEKSKAFNSGYSYKEEYVYTLDNLLIYLEDAFSLKQATNDKLLNNVINLVYNIVKQNSQYNYVIDFHELNVMFRRTSVGPQLVITDPLHSALIEK